MATLKTDIGIVSFVLFVFDRYAAGSTPSREQIVMALQDFDKVLDDTLRYNPPVGGGDD